MSEATISLCPECLERVDARFVVEDGSMYLLKHCPRHGEQRALLEKNAPYYLARNSFDKPGTVSKTQTQVKRGCPFDCGLCPDHQQHTCIGLLEITNQCNLDCPDCYARPHGAQSSSSARSMLTLEQISRMMDFFQDAESGKAEVLQISGGEPTLHPQILDILSLAKTKRFKCVMLNTNGLRLAADESFARALGELAGGFEVYLQFDGFDRAACKELRGSDLVETKQKALEHLARHRVPTTLVATIKRGVNDHELGRLLELGINAGSIRGINFQPLALFRGGNRRDGESRTTLTDILEQIETQTKGAIRLKDFVPLPCDVERVAITYLCRSRGRFRPITRGVDLRPYLPDIPNTFAFDADDFLEAERSAPALREPITRAAQSAAVRGCGCAEPFLKVLRPLIPKSYATRSAPEKVEHVSRNTFRVSVSSFVDPYNFDLKSMRKECVHVITPDLRRIPFSAYNMFHRIAKSETNSKSQ